MPKALKKVISSMKKRPRERSIVWQYLEKLDAKRAYCTLCPKEIKHYGNTANAMQHLRRVHSHIFYGATNQSPPTISGSSMRRETAPAPATEVSIITTPTDPIEYVSVTSPEYQPKYIEVVHSGPAKKTAPTKRIIRKNAIKTVAVAARDHYANNPYSKTIVRMICKDLHQPSIVEECGFKELMDQLNCSLPTTKELMGSLIPANYEEVRLSLKELLILANQITISYDAWTVEESRTYLTITAHYIALGQLRSSVLSTVEVLEVNPSDNIAKCVWAELQNWGIEYKVGTIVTVDDESLVQSAGLLELTYLPCIGTILEQCATELFERDPVQNLMEKCRHLVAFFKCSEVAVALEKRLDELGEPRVRVISEDSRRWLSTWKMMERLLLLKDHLQALSYEITNCPDLPTAAEWNIINDTVALLKQFELLTDTELAVERYPTLPKMLPLLKGLRYTIQLYPNISSHGQLMKDHLIETINNRLGYLESNDIACKATLLDPRFKNLLFDEDSNQAETAERALEIELAALFRAEAGHEEIAGEDDGEKLKPLDTPSLWSQLDKKVRKSLKSNKTTPEANARSMLQQYLNKAIVARTEDPLDFWRTHKNAFPQLHELAMKYLCIPAIAVPSEWLYPTNGSRLKEKRNMLPAGPIMDQIIFLNSNIDISLGD